MKQIDKQAKERYLERLKLIKEGASENPFETKDDQAERIAKAKKDVAFMVEYYLPHYATSKSAKFQISLAKYVVKHKTCRVLVRWGRGMAKSVWCDLIIILWLWMRGESTFAVIVGNTSEKAIELLSDIQAEFEANPRIIHDFGEQQCRGSWENGNFSTRDNRLHATALGMRQSVRGLRKGALRPNYIVCDDLENQETQKNPKRQDEIVKWIENDLLKTMDGETRRYLHPNNDPFERSIQNVLEERHPDWKLNMVKAYDKKSYEPAWKEKYTAQYYIDQEKDGILSAHAEFLHEPLIEGSVFTKELIQWAKAPRLTSYKIIVGHWDVAYSGKNDYNAIKVWGLHGINFWHIKAFVRQCKMEDAVRWIYDYEDTLPEGTIILWRVEKQFWGDPVQQAIEQVAQERGRNLNISVVDRSRQDKLQRMLSVHPYYQNRRIYYSQEEFSNNDMNVGLKQLYGIEPGYRTHDDSPDADQQAIEYLSTFVIIGNKNNLNIQHGGHRRQNRI